MPLIPLRRLSPNNNKPIFARLLSNITFRPLSPYRCISFWCVRSRNSAAVRRRDFAYFSGAVLGFACAGIASAADAGSLNSAFRRTAFAPPQSSYRHNVQASAGFDVENVAGPAGAALPVMVRLPQDGGANYRFLMFRRLPDGFKLSAGFGTPSYWVVSLGDVYRLSLLTPPDAKGAFELDALLFRGEGNEPERRKARIVLQPPGVVSDSPRAVAPPPPAVRDVVTTGAVPVPAAVAPLANADLPMDKPAPREITLEDRSILLRGNKLFEEGNVTQARLFYQHLAKKGISAGALAMAQTYDPKFLDELGVRGGIKPDVFEARKWYELANDLARGQTGKYSSAP